MLVGMRWGGASAAPPSIHVGLIAPALLEVGDEGDGFAGVAAAMLGDDVDHGALDVLAHADRAADVEVRAVRKPLPEIGAELAHAVLDVELLLVVARPREREPGAHARRPHAG